MMDFTCGVLSAGEPMVTDLSAPQFWWRISSWPESMPQTSIWAPLVHKTTMEQIIGSNLLLKPMLPANIQIHATPLTITMPGYHLHPHRQHYDLSVIGAFSLDAIIAPENWSRGA